MAMCPMVLLANRMIPIATRYAAMNRDILFSIFAYV